MPSKKRARKSAAEGDGSDGSEKVSDSESPVEEIEQKRLTFKDDTDHEEESMVEEKKQASNSSTANKVILYVVYVNVNFDIIMSWCSRLCTYWYFVESSRLYVSINTWSYKLRDHLVIVLNL